MDEQRQKRTRELQEQLFGGERRSHLAFTKRLGGALIIVCVAALGFLVLDRGFWPWYSGPKAAVEGERLCLVYQRKLFGREAASFFVFASGDGWAQRQRFFGECVGAGLKDEELLLFFEGGSYGKYVGKEWQKAGDWPLGWIVRGSAWVGEGLHFVGTDGNVRRALWEGGEWRDAGKGPEVAGTVKDLSVIRTLGEELWVVWSDDSGKWLVRSGSGWGTAKQLPVEGSSEIGAAAGTSEGRFWVFYSSKDKGDLVFAEVNQAGEVLRRLEAPRELRAGRISGIEATRVREKAWVFLTGFNGVKRLYFDGNGWEDGGWVEKVGWVRRAGTATGLMLLSLMPVLTMIMAAAVLKMQEWFRQALLGVKESYLAEWWKRAAAQLLDALLLIPIGVGVLGLLMSLDIWTLTLGTFGLWLIYLVGTEGVWGRTLGKAALGLSVIGEGGGRPGITAVVARNLLRAVDFLPVGYIAGFLVAGRGLLRQRIGDRVGRTVVVNRGGMEKTREWTA